MNTEDVMTIQEAAAALGISRQSVYKAITAGRLKILIVLGKSVLMRKEVAAYNPRAYRGRPGRAVGGRPKKDHKK